MIHGSKKADAAKKPTVSYWSKNKCTCPVCHKTFEREEMLSGNGRMIAGDLTDELHRIYEPSTRFGKIYPLLYSVGACPQCNTALFWDDFDELRDSASIRNIREDEGSRVKAVSIVFPHYNLTKERSLYDGAAMYYLALLTYEKMNTSYLPTIKRAIISLRLGWLGMDLEEICPDHNFKYVADIFYKKAIFFYQQAVINETERIEQSSSLANSGPDVDKNYGWDGVVYLCGLLEYKYGQREDPVLRLKKLNEFKTAIARIFGLGKSSKSKPGPLLEKSRALYDNLAAEIAESETIKIGGI